ncbi:hypothetical protein M1K46_11775 [Fictibacillus sp. WQ 8-8]|uniref:hypothetical protein n=1 Tax=Fictibacillus sp. WQ 8-8 TaxID=2938788 RepID=UPI00210F069B|nr:hypothetical protein [Fictibacillus sp. WQ 8-8]MCQ6266336.1 hypothetical protein [Fictibacillus sp. WQ 8-8]
MKKLIMISWGILLLAGCGSNDSELDKEKTQNAVSMRALEQKVIKDGGYTSKDIKLVKACEAIENGKSEFKGNYIVSWKTKDDKYERALVMKNYKTFYGTNNFKINSDQCIDY